MFFKNIFLKREGLSDARVASMTKKTNMVFPYIFYKDSKSLKS